MTENPTETEQCRLVTPNRDDGVQSMEHLIEAGVEAAKRGKPNEAFAWICHAARLHPNRYEPHYFLGCMHASKGQHEKAILCLNRALEAKPSDIEVTRALVLSLRRTNRFAEAELETRNWSKISPNDPGARATLAHIFMEQYRLDEALSEASAAAALAPESVDAIILVARILAQLGRAQEASTALLRARERAPDRPDVLLHLGNILKIEGRFDEARAALYHALKADPANAAAFFELAEITHFSQGDPLLAEMEKLAAVEPAAPQPASLHFALGKAHDDVDQVESAFRHFAIANAREHAENRYDEGATLAAIARIKDIFSPAFVERLRGSGNPSDLPIFIVGMPRSGTTLVEQILANHSVVAAGGELHHFHLSVDAVLASRSNVRAFPENLAALVPEDVTEIGERYLSHLMPLAGTRSRVTDKLPANALLVGLVHAALPNAKVIHCKRDPIDTCLSCFMTSFGRRVPYSTDLSTLGRYYRAQTKLMDHWRSVLPAESFLDLRYEDVVADLEGQARRLTSHCELDWDPHCVQFHKARRSVNTASVSQVRKPIYDSSIGRGRRYAAHLGPLVSALRAQ
jgi:tetratricopeptide (TPR) repeat protein